MNDLVEKCGRESYVDRRRDKQKGNAYLFVKFSGKRTVFGQNSGKLLKSTEGAILLIRRNSQVQDRGVWQT
jgi:hypothetical protein